MVADQDDRVEPVAAAALAKDGSASFSGEVGDRPHLDPLRHALAFDVGADHVPVADGDLIDPTGAQRLDDREDLVGHQPPAARIGSGVRG